MPITDPDRTRAFYEALGFEYRRDGRSCATARRKRRTTSTACPARRSELEFTLNHDGRTYDNGTGYGHIAIGVEDLDGTLERLKGEGIEPERAPYTVSDGGSRLCFVRDPDDYRVEIIEKG